MRQRDELRRQLRRGEHGRDVFAPSARALDPATEPVGLTELEADIGERRRERTGVGVPAERVAPDFVDPRGIALQRLPGGERLGGGAQRRGPAVARGGDGLAPRVGPRRRIGQRRDAVDHAEVACVVHEALPRADLGVDADPEVDIALQLGIARHDGLCGRDAR